MVRGLGWATPVAIALVPACMAGADPDLLDGVPRPDAGADPFRDTTPPVLERLPLDVTGPYDPSTARLGSLNCSPVSDRPADREMGCFRGFGSGGSDPARGVTFVTDAATRIRAVGPGNVEGIHFLVHDHLTHADMFAIVTRAGPDSAFALEYRHVKNVEVKVGDTVETGQVLGRAGDYFDLEHGKVTLSVLRTQVFTQHLCPERFLSTEARDAVGEVLGAHRDAWPAHADAELCHGVSVFCRSDRCAEEPAALAFGDVEAGRSIYRNACASCHGTDGRGGVGPPLRPDADMPCGSCGAHPALSDRTALDMPPEGRCVGRCADDVAAFIRAAFEWR